MIAAREVGAADAAAKQHVADLGQRGGSMEEHQMPRRVTGTVQHLQALLADADLIAGREPAVGLEGRVRREAEHLRLLRQGSYQLS
jgi:hypothetical protein